MTSLQSFFCVSGIDTKPVFETDDIKKLSYTKNPNIIGLL